jgi:hypothetical protein
VTLDVQGRCSRIGSPDYRQSSRHLPAVVEARHQGGQWIWPCSRRSWDWWRCCRCCVDGGRGGGPAWPEELGSDRPRQREQECGRRSLRTRFSRAGGCWAAGPGLV